MPSLGVHRGDHPVRGHPPRDPPPPIAAVGALGGFHVLPGDQGQQRHRLLGPVPGLLVQPGRALIQIREPFEQGEGIVDQRGH